MRTVRQLISRGILTIIFLLVLCHFSVLAGDKDEMSMVVNVIRPEPTKTVVSMVVFVSGGGAQEDKIIQDALVCQLRDMKKDAVSRITLEKLVAKDFEKWAASYTSDSATADDQYNTDEASIARLAGADAYLSCSISYGRLHGASFDSKANISIEKVVVAAVSFHLVETSSEHVILEGVIAYEIGANLADAASDLCGILKQNGQW